MAAVLLGALAPAAHAQTASLAGSVVDRYGVAVARAPVEVRNTASGATYRTFASDDATYAFSRLPAGTYDVSVTLIGFRQYRREDVALDAGRAVRLDIQMEDGETLNTPGEFYFRRAVGKPPEGPTPRTSDGKPDFSGVWLPSANTNPEPPPILPAAEAQRKQRFASGVTPRSLCLPTGIVLTPEIDLTKFVHTPKLLVILVEGGDPGFRQIFLDGRAHPKDPFPTWQGHSVGRWEGDTLVVDTVGFNDRVSLTLTEHPQTEQMHVVERIRRPALGRLEIEDTLDDPGATEAVEGAPNADPCPERRVTGVRLRGKQQGEGAPGGPLICTGASPGEQMQRGCWSCCSSSSPWSLRPRRSIRRALSSTSRRPRRSASGTAAVTGACRCAGRWRLRTPPLERLPRTSRRRPVTVPA